ncbi:uncharacterized protein LOC135116958 [Helicoverpa armigera]|uniref:uncharacterized protein LOC135116958 n=1 Tax=Helicoverpa armigera TaxID=29058 RepID=UPI003082CA5C
MSGDAIMQVGQAPASRSNTYGGHELRVTERVRTNEAFSFFETSSNTEDQNMRAQIDRRSPLSFQRLGGQKRSQLNHYYQEQEQRRSATLMNLPLAQFMKTYERYEAAVETSRAEGRKPHPGPIDTPLMVSIIFYFIHLSYVQCANELNHHLPSLFRTMLGSASSLSGCSLVLVFKFYKVRLPYLTYSTQLYGQPSALW